MKKKILYLYSELMPYVIPVLIGFVNNGYGVVVVKWDRMTLTPYVPPKIDNIEYINRSFFTTVEELYSYICGIDPVIIFVAGWMDKLYYKTAKRVKKTNNIPIIAGCDSQWRGGLQWGNVLFSKFRHQKWYTHIMVAGERQYEYARRLGFDSQHIISPLYSANVDLFRKIEINDKQKKNPHKFLFVGRLSEEKGLFLLIKAWGNIKNKQDWTLTIIGNGPLVNEVKSCDNIAYIDFISQENLCNEMEKAGCLILPSLFEPWGLVIHEAAAAGLPIIASSCCGANTQFLINNYNGFTFKTNNFLAIEEAIKKIISMPDNELYKMGLGSKRLSTKITPEYITSSILSVL